MKNSIVNILIKNFPRLKKIKFNSEDDLIKTGIIDSLELMKLIQHLEKKYDFSFNEYSKKNNNFKIKNLDKYI
jgi:acyl carrier protein